MQDVFGRARNCSPLVSKHSKILRNMATPSTRLLVKAPDKGSFPLDHQGLCKNQMRVYMRCLYANDKKNSMCRHEAKDYFYCRMENNLMEKDEWKRLGFNDLEDIEGPKTENAKR